MIAAVHPALGARNLKFRTKRAVPQMVAKNGAALGAQLASKGLNKVLGMTMESFDSYRAAAQKKSSSGGWLTVEFIDLLYVPTVNLMMNKIRTLENKFEKQTDEREDHLVAVICLSAVVPTLMVLLFLVCIINVRRVNRVRDHLFEQGRAVELLSTAATAGRCGPVVRGAAQGQSGGPGTGDPSSGPVINLNQ